MTKEDFIAAIRIKYPAGFKQEPIDNYEKIGQSPDGKLYQQYNLRATSKKNRYESISLFNNFQGNDEIEKFAVNVNLKHVEKGYWQKIFYTFDEAIQLYTELIGEDATWYAKTKKIYSPLKS
jgi:hypothetical protein